eukprot:SM000032S12169  [mRNA]  locus=s32:861437:861764:- [translate_table: standard]
MPTYADDTTLVGQPDEVLAAFATLEEQLQEIGLDIRASKARQPSSACTPAVRHQPGGLTLLGVPLGSPAFVYEQLRGKLQEHLKPAARPPELHDMQLALAC